jgi:lipopolysaccharide transport system ATP-binding protein
MFMRLAFSIVSSLEPDILILDEVLAVGDIHFQTKSLNRILDFKKTGKTILFCSHDTYHVRMICDHVIWLRDGRIYLEGEPEQVVCAYESYQFQKGETRGETQISDRPVLIESLELKHAGNLSTGDTMQLCLNTLVSNPDLSYNIMLSLKLPDGRGVYVTGTHLNQAGTLKGNRIITIMFPSIRLLSGNYYFHARIFDEAGLILYHEKATPFFTVGKRLQDLGICSVENEWSIA